MKIGLSENFTNKITNALKENERNRKSMKEDNYESGIFFEIETALYEAGLQPSRFSDDGVLTNNLGWTVTSPETGETQQLTCDGSWLSESSEEAIDGEFKVGDIVKVPYKYGSYTPGEFTEAPIINIEDGKYVTVEVPSKQVVMMDQLKKWNSELDEGLKESTDLSEEGFDTWNGFKNELRKAGGLYGLVSNEAHHMSTDLLKEIALNALYYAEGHEEEIAKDIKERYYDYY